MRMEKRRCGSAIHGSLLLLGLLRRNNDFKEALPCNNNEAANHLSGRNTQRHALLKMEEV